MACTLYREADQDGALVYQWHTLDDLIDAIFKLSHRRIDVFIPAVLRPDDPMRDPGYIGTADHIKKEI